jgi:hypothetical protein
VTESKTGEAIPFANIILFENGTQITGTTTDFDGKYKLSKVPTGNSYSLKVTSVGYQAYETVGIVVEKYKLTFVDFKLEMGNAA